MFLRIRSRRVRRMSRHSNTLARPGSMKSTTGGRHLLSILAATLFSAGCGRGAPEGAFTGDWVRVDHPSAWLVTLAEDGAAALRNRTLDETVRGRWTAIDTSDVVIVAEGLRHGLPDTLRLGVKERAGGTLRATGSDGDPWVLVLPGTSSSSTSRTRSFGVAASACAEAKTGWGVDGPGGTACSSTSGVHPPCTIPTRSRGTRSSSSAPGSARLGATSGFPRLAP